MKTGRHISLAHLHLLSPKFETLLFFYPRFEHFVFILSSRTDPQYFSSSFFFCPGQCRSLESSNCHSAMHFNFKLKIGCLESLTCFSQSYLGYRVGTTFIGTNWQSKLKIWDLNWNILTINTKVNDNFIPCEIKF